MEKSYIIIDKVGLHARPVSLLSRTASQFKNDIFIIYQDKRVTLKSILMVMSLGVPSGSEITIEVMGENPIKAHKAIETVLKEQGVV
ncbi:MAG: HPr family phosphocarrier protein [Candidatus Izemoplasmataceae bacterium]